MVRTMYEFNDYRLIPFSRRVLENNNIESDYYNWFNNSETTKYNSHGLFPKSAEEMEAFLNAQDRPNNNSIHYAIIAKKVDNNIFVHIGNASLQSINWVNRSGEIAIVIGESDYRGMGLGEKVCSILIKHGFEKLNLHRIWTGTAATNIAMNKVAEKIGMKKEGCFRDGMYLHGKYVDINCFSILEKEIKNV